MLLTKDAEQLTTSWMPVMNKVWAPEAREDYVWWQSQDRKILKRISLLTRDIERYGVKTGTGKPEYAKRFIR